MNKFMRSVRGVTLLEVMLVLAIAAMIIVMSVRYYQSAQQSSQANAYAAQIQAVAGVAENLSAGSGSIPTSATITPAMPANTWFAPWGGGLTYTSTATTFTLTPAVAPSTNVCTLVIAKFPAGGKVSVAAGTCAATYDSTK